MNQSARLVQRERPEVVLHQRQSCAQPWKPIRSHIKRITNQSEIVCGNALTLYVRSYRSELFFLLLNSRFRKRNSQKRIQKTCSSQSLQLSRECPSKGELKPNDAHTCYLTYTTNPIFVINWTIVSNFKISLFKLPDRRGTFFIRQFAAIELIHIFSTELPISRNYSH